MLNRNVANNFPSPGLSATLSPSDGERDGVRGFPPFKVFATLSEVRTMKTIAVTGGVGMGKSTTANLIGVPVVDTDDLARAVVEPGQPALGEIVAAFGKEMLDGEGRLRREELARVVFADAEKRKQLEAILHPRIAERWRAYLRVWREAGAREAAVVIPLLYEAGYEAEFDTVICVACSAAAQRERLRARGWSDDEIARRNAAQLPVETKLARARYVIWTEADLETHARQLERILNQGETIK
ncbi:MAG: dephospho-CoA kinase [Verrucomicrobia bacterium]|nr:MAG: dephospho-CoA kinase [Verrucomicrobiota bacterium]